GQYGSPRGPPDAGPGSRTGGVPVKPAGHRVVCPTCLAAVVAPPRTADSVAAAGTAVVLLVGVLVFLAANGPTPPQDHSGHLEPFLVGGPHRLDRHDRQQGPHRPVPIR